MPATKYAEGKRIAHREDGETGVIYRVLTGVQVDYATPIYEVLWDHEPGEPAMGSRHYADELQDAADHAADLAEHNTQFAGRPYDGIPES